MRGFNLDQLQTFMNVVELGSFSAAADKLKLSQPAVSQQVRHLEKGLGVRLIERAGKRAKPTSAGAELLKHAYHIDQMVAAARESMIPHAEGVTGSVRLGTGATACIYFLPTCLRELRRRFPDLEIIVNTGSSDDILRQLEQNLIDVAVVTLPAPGRMFDVHPLLEDEFVLIAPRAEGIPEKVTPAALARRTLVLHESGANTRRLVDKWFAKGNQAAKPAMELDSVEATKQLVAAGLGLGIVPAMALPPRSTSGLVSHPLSPRLVRKLGLVVRRDKRLYRGLRETIAPVKQAAATFKGR
jgi:DNA-binding transcriptional LysR family regulator